MYSNILGQSFGPRWTQKPIVVYFTPTLDHGCLQTPGVFLLPPTPTPSFYQLLSEFPSLPLSVARDPSWKLLSPPRSLIRHPSRSSPHSAPVSWLASLTSLCSVPSLPPSPLKFFLSSLQPLFLYSLLLLTYLFSLSYPKKNTFPRLSSLLFSLYTEAYRNCSNNRSLHLSPLYIMNQGILIPDPHPILPPDCSWKDEKHPSLLSDALKSLIFIWAFYLF